MQLDRDAIVDWLFILLEVLGLVLAVGLLIRFYYAPAVTDHSCFVTRKNGEVQLMIDCAKDKGL